MRIEIGTDLSTPKYPERSVGRKILINRDPVREPKRSRIKERLREQLFAPDHRIQFDSLIAKCCPLLTDTYWPDIKWYYHVYAPLDKQYDNKRPWFESKKWLDFVRKRYSSSVWSLIMTVEKDASKHHVNVLFSTPGQPDPLPSDNIIDGYCYVHNEDVTPNTQLQVCRYIFKEAKTRPFTLYEDYYLHQRAPLAPSPQDESYDYPMPENEPYPVWIPTN